MRNRTLVRYGACMHRTEGTVRLRTGQFRRHAEQAGLASDNAIALALGVNRTTVMRLLAGDITPGPRVIGSVLLTWPEKRFEDFFEAVAVARSRVAA